MELTLGRLLPKAFTTLDRAQHQLGDGVGRQGLGVNRSEAISLTIAAVVSGVLPNGNLVIQGNQEVKINNELRQLTVAGIVRPEDITAANTINHTQIAEARVSYGGKGAIPERAEPAGGPATPDQVLAVLTGTNLSAHS